MEPHQLDIFADSREVMLRNDLAAALVACDGYAARSAAASLRAEAPYDPMLAPALRLIEHLAHEQAIAAETADPQALIAERAVLEQRVGPAARAVLGTAAASWLAARWRHLARRARALPWQAELADAHAAGLFVAAGAWPEAAEAVLSIESWRRIPQPLRWMVQARWALHGADATWPLLAEALWLAPAAAAQLIPQLADAGLARLARRFEQAFDPEADPDGEGWAWMPAWVLIYQPLLADALASAEPKANSAPAEGFTLIAALLRLERQGRHHDIIEQRKRLRALSLPLFQAYMATR